MTDPFVELIDRVGFDEAAKIVAKSIPPRNGKPQNPRVWLAEYLDEQALIHNHEYFTGKCLKIRTKAGQIQPLVLNAGQKKIQAAIQKQKKAGKPIRIKLLKARQFGGSTDFQATFFQDAMFHKHKQFLTVCHDMDSAKNMRAMFERFHEHYNRAKPVLKKQSGGDKWWKLSGRDVDYLIDTADELDTGRSFTIHRLHASEVAFYRDPETLMVGLLQAVPEDPDTMVFVESTGNGIGDWFYQFVNNKNDYELVFVAWFEIEEYTRPLDNDKQKLELERSLDSYEKALLDRVTLEQLNWRRHTIENRLNGDEQKFQQEYPATVDDAFIASGRPYFPVTKIRPELIRTEKLTPTKGWLNWKEHGKSVEFEEAREGWWTLFEEPQEGYEYRYVTGSDSAEGKMVKEASKEPDNSVCRVFDRIANKEVAAFCARIDTDLFAIEIYKASVWYRSACDCIERNSSGLAVIDALKDKEGVYLYRRELIGKVDDKETVEYGWQTNTASRDTLMSDLRTRLRDKSYQSDDKELWSELLTFVVDDKGVPRGQRGTHDDRVLAAGLVIQASIQANEVNPISRPDAPKRPREKGDDREEETMESKLVYAEF